MAEDTVQQAKDALAAAEAALAASKGKGVSGVIAATKAVQAAKKELAAAEKGVSTAGKTRTEVIQETRAVDMTAKAEQRATVETPSPTGTGTIKAFDIENRPAAPAPDNDFVYYYSWVGGATTGEWRLYRAANTPENMAAYGSRAVGGSTQASYGTSTKGAQALDVQPQPIKNNLGQVIGWTTPTGASAPGVGGTGTAGTGGTGGTGTGGTGAGGTGTGGAGTSGTGTGGTGVGGTPISIPSGLDPATTALIQSLQAQINALTTNLNKQDAAAAQAKIDAAAAEAAAKQEKTQNAITVLTDRFNKYGLGSLVPKIRELAIAGASEDTIALQLQETPEYQARFSANQARIKKGLTVLSPAEYLNLEDDYRQILRAYGLRQFDNDDYVTQFISNDISTTELSNRVATAVQRVQNADPAILTTLRSFYGISDNDLVAYVLDPNQQFQKIERQVAAAEIGAAAGIQGLSTGVAVAEQLAAQGITKAQAQKGYATIADILPTAEKLSDIYGGTLDEYRQNEAEQEVFNTLASAQRKRQSLIAREAAAFSGASGLSRSSLTRQIGGNI